MAYLHDDILDNGLSELSSADALYLCTQEPAYFAEATDTYACGLKTSPTVSVPGARTGGGRKVTITGVTEGVITLTSTATHWALVDTVEERLLAAASLSASQAVTSGNTFSLSSFDIGIPGPA